MAALNLFPARVPFVNADGTLTPEAYRTLQELLNRTGGVLGNVGADVFFADAGQPGSNGIGDIPADVFGSQAVDHVQAEMVTQPATQDYFVEMVMQQPQERAMTAPELVTVGASPFTFQANRDGFLIVTGGTVSQQEYGRGATFTDVGLLTSMLPVLLGDSIRVTYSAVPTITFIPR